MDAAQPLSGKAVHEVEVDADLAGGPAVGYDRGDALAILDATDIGLDLGDETLHAERHALEATLAEQHDVSSRGRARVELDGPTAGAFTHEYGHQPIEHAPQLLGREVGRRTAAEVELGQLSA